ncbi:hypothetical protein M1446_03600 [Candidatus Dependentiae bacterium]|nr:hypothetical protein [Candidatus Dependentiae bacterium]
MKIFKFLFFTSIIFSPYFSQAGLADFGKNNVNPNEKSKIIETAKIKSKKIGKWVKENPKKSIAATIAVSSYAISFYWLYVLKKREFGSSLIYAPLYTLKFSVNKLRDANFYLYQFNEEWLGYFEDCIKSADSWLDEYIPLIKKDPTRPVFTSGRGSGFDTVRGNNYQDCTL